jgi:hypothetical protein
VSGTNCHPSLRSLTISCDNRLRRAPLRANICRISVGERQRIPSLRPRKSPVVAGRLEVRWEGQSPSTFGSARAGSYARSDAGNRDQPP